ncbi:MAG: hypothetical protein M3Y48_05695 [Actinomycetota bacterium]|nr:hypothetical protein [Actinomycetota bacterium]
MRRKVMECNRVVRVAGRVVRQDVPQRLIRGEVVVRLVDALLRSQDDVEGSLNEVAGLRGATGARR